MKISLNIPISQTSQPSHFKPAYNLEIRAEFHPIQNVILLSLEKEVSEDQIKQIVKDIRKEIINEHKKLIADDALCFDALVMQENGDVKRYTLPKADSENDDLQESDFHMFAFKFSADSYDGSDSNYNISPLSNEEMRNPAIVKQIIKLIFGKFDIEKYYLSSESKAVIDNTGIKEEVLSETNYPSFIKNWASYLLNATDAKEFLQNLLGATTKFYIAKDKENMLGALAISSSHDESLHYLSFFIVDKQHRGHTISKELLQKALKDISGNNKVNPTYAFYTDQDFMLELIKRIGINISEARLTTEIKCEKVPVIQSFDPKPLPPRNLL